MSNSAFSRLLKFALVGAVGIGVQLGVLTALTAMRINYLPATALGVECALVHNFFGHQHFTWTDRAIRASLASLVRFHLSNGIISLAGNLLLMRLLVGKLMLPVLLANVISIAACFVANFLAADRWVFFVSPGKPSKPIGAWNHKCAEMITPRAPVPRRSVPASAPRCAARMEHKSERL